MPKRRKKTKKGRIKKSGTPKKSQKTKKTTKSRPETDAEEIHDWNMTFNSIFDAVCILGPDLKNQRCNKAMRKLLGKPENTIIDRKCHELVHTTKKPIKGCPMQRMEKTHKREKMLLLING